MNEAIPTREEALKRCELGTGCAHAGECFLANIRGVLSSTAFNAATEAELLPDLTSDSREAFKNKTDIIKDLESKLAKCGIEITVAEHQQNTA